MPVRTTGNTFPTAATFNALQAVLLEKYPDYITDLMPEEATMVALFGQFEGLEAGGRGLFLPHSRSRNISASARPESGVALPGAQSRTLDKFEIETVQYYASGGFSRKALAKAARGGSLVNLFDMDVDHTVRDLARALNADLYNHPDGVLAVIEAVNGVTLDLHPTNLGEDFGSGAAPHQNFRSVQGTRHLEVGMPIQVLDLNDDGTLTFRDGATARTVATRPDFNTITMSAAAAGTAAGDVIIRAGTHGDGSSDNVTPTGSMSGLDYLIDDGNSTIEYFNANFQGKARSASSAYLSIVRDLAGAVIDVDSGHVPRQVIDQITDSFGGQPDMVLTTRPGAELLYEMYSQGQRFMRNTETSEAHGGYLAGTLSVAAGGRPLSVYVDRDCPYQTFYFINSRHMKRITEVDFELVDEDGSVLRQGSTGDDTWQYTLRWEGNMATDAPAAHGKIIDVDGVGLDPSQGSMHPNHGSTSTSAVIY